MGGQRAGEHKEIELEMILWYLVRNNCPCWQHLGARTGVMGTCLCTQMLDFSLGGSCPTNVRGNGNRSEAPDGHCLLPLKFLVPVLS